MSFESRSVYIFFDALHICGKPFFFNRDAYLACLEGGAVSMIEIISRPVFSSVSKTTSLDVRLA